MTIQYSPMKIRYGENIKLSMSGTWPAYFRKCRVSTIIWYQDLPEPIYKTNSLFKRVQCHHSGLASYNICQYRKGEEFQEEVEIPLRFKSNHIYVAGSLFTSGWYTFKCRLFDEFDEEFLCAELKLYIMTTRK